MNLKKSKLKNVFSSAKKPSTKKGASVKKKKSAPFHGYAPGHKEEEPLRRNGKLIVPIGVQTVIAVLVCCGVLLLVGAGIFTSQQMEIADLKAEIKTYVDDGVVPAGSMSESLSLNIEAVGGRVEMIQHILDSVEDGKLSNKDIQWIGAEINEIQIESERLNEVLTAAEADNTLRKLYNETVQSPLVTLTEVYDTMTVNDADIVDTAVEDGAVSDTGAFKVSGDLEKNLRWIVVIGVLVILLLMAVLFRHKIAGLFRRNGKKQPKARDRKETEKTKVAPGKGDPVKKKPAQNGKPAKETHTNPLAEDAEEGSAEEAEAETVINGDEEFFAAVEKMAAQERKNAEEGAGMPEPSEADRISFDANVVTQEDIEEDDDPLFHKGEA